MGTEMGWAKHGIGKVGEAGVRAGNGYGVEGWRHRRHGHDVIDGIATAETYFVCRRWVERVFEHMQAGWTYPDII